MTQEEFMDLKVGDVVYYYKSDTITRASQINASVKRKVVEKIFDDKDRRRIGLTHGGVIFLNFLHLFELDKNKAIYSKLQKIKQTLRTPPKVLNVRLAEIKFQKVLSQKNIHSMLEKYPELLI